MKTYVETFYNINMLKKFLKKISFYQTLKKNKKKDIQKW